jgi:putative Holliday junction resolvase
MRILGVDYGSSRIGLAIGETEVRLAFPRPPLKGTGNLAADATAIANLAKDEECALVLIGLPLLTSGGEGEQSRISRELGDRISDEGVAVEFADERFTTAAAMMNLGHLPADKRKAATDSEAARILLTEYLASKDA